MSLMNIWYEIDRLPREHKLALVRHILRSTYCRHEELRRIAGRTVDRSYKTKGAA
jgi:hypothetical protein